MEETQNCRNCGAPLDGNGDCEYCGSKSPRSWESVLEITPCGIRLSAGIRGEYPRQLVSGE